MTQAAIFRFAVVWPDTLKDPGPVDARARDHYWRNVIQPVIVANIGQIIQLQWQQPQTATDKGSTFRVHDLLLTAEAIPPAVARHALKVVDNPAPVEVSHVDH